MLCVYVSEKTVVITIDKAKRQEGNPWKGRVSNSKIISTVNIGEVKCFLIKVGITELKKRIRNII